MKTVNFTIELNDEEEISQFEYWLREQVKVKYFRVLPNSDHLKEDITYKILRKLRKNADINLYNYIDNHRL